MINETIEYIKQKNYKNVGILSTRGTRDTKLYQDFLELNNINCTIVDEKHQKLLDEIIYNKEWGIKSLSYATEKATQMIKDVINYLISINSNLDCIILGCTELPLAILSNYYQEIELIDPLKILAKTMLIKYNIAEKNT